MSLTPSLFSSLMQVPILADIWGYNSCSKFWFLHYSSTGAACLKVNKGFFFAITGGLWAEVFLLIFLCWLNLGPLK